MFLEYLNVSLLMMRAKPVRAILSLLGIYVGVLALAIILAIRDGVRNDIESLYRTSGANIVYVHPGFDNVAKKIGRITLDDCRRLAMTPHILSSVPRLTTETDVRTTGGSLHAKMVGIDEQFIALYRVPMVRGRTFLKEEVSKRQAICLLTVEAVRKLFPVSEPLGARLEIKGVSFTVVGVVHWTPQAAQRTSVQEVDILVPILWVMPKEGDMITMLEVRVRPEIRPTQALELVKNAMTHGEAAREKLYFIRSLDQFVQRSREFNDRILGGLLGIAAISLVVGGIGIANVMVTSVTERTKEVGIRKALGATRTQILAQFMVESGVLSGSGGLLAVVSAALGVSLATNVFGVTTPLIISLWPSVGCVVLTVCIGLLAGVYPASRAASLSPAEALRYE